MDKAEGALSVAEKALAEARQAVSRLNAMLPPRNVKSFRIDADGDLLVIYSDGAAEKVGRVRGNDGAPGADGASVLDAAVDQDGCLSLRLSDGRTVNAGRVRGEPGAPGKDAQSIPGPAGRSVVRGAVDDNGHLCLTYTDGTSEDVGLVAIKGEPGEPGAAGSDGVGIARLAIDGTDLKVTMTDGTGINLGRVVGHDGKPGAPGKDGRPGASIKGERGEPGPSVEIAFGDSLPANITAKSLDRIRAQTIVLDGQEVRVLVLS
jgi:hypothetical protein